MDGDSDRPPRGRRDHRDLRVWQEACILARSLVVVRWQLRRAGHRHLGDQIGRAATSIHANIAEGCGRAGRAELRRFLTIAWSSMQEVDSHLAEALSIGRVAPNALATSRRHLVHVARLLAALRRSLDPT
jgi:four helix bundle protein